MCPDRLRLPLVFYYAHTATVYTNKMLAAGLISERVNRDFEVSVVPPRPESPSASRCLSLHPQPGTHTTATVTATAAPANCHLTDEAPRPAQSLGTLRDRSRRDELG
jgi:hypothetical protein